MRDPDCGLKILLVLLFIGITAYAFGSAYRDFKKLEEIENKKSCNCLK